MVDDHTVLRRIDLEVPDGRLVALTGPSGSGKSTLLRLCNRLEVPTTGSVSFRQVPLDQVDPLELRRRVGMVFQRPTPFAGTVLANLRVADPDLGAPDAVDRCRRVGLDPDLLDRDASTLSGGEAQRMCLARSLCTGPEVLPGDEPTSALDPASRDAVESLVRGLVADGIAVLWVSHDPEQIRRLADTVVHVREGCVAEVVHLRTVGGRRPEDHR